MDAYISSSQSTEWYTPRAVLDAVIAVLGAIDCDPASNPPPYNVPAAVHYTAAENGLAQPWPGRVFLNPPYGKGKALVPWMRYLLQELALGRCSAAVVLIPARTDTEAFQVLWQLDALCFVRGRLKFNQSRNSAPFPSVLGYAGPDPDRFAGRFAPWGEVLPLWRLRAPQVWPVQLPLWERVGP